MTFCNCHVRLKRQVSSDRLDTAEWLTMSENASDEYKIKNNDERSLESARNGFAGIRVRDE